MKVLIVSHNCISATTNMGKTLLSYFHGFPIEDIAQLYIHCEEPTDDTICRRYFRFTDTDAAKSILSRHGLGRSFGEGDIHTERIHPRTDTGWLRKAYQYGEKRRAVTYALRELLWKLSRWDSEKLQKWVEDFGPDVVFFASGDYGFSYEIAEKIARSRKIPLAVCCVDDYYLHNRNENTWLGRLVHRSFLKRVKKCMAYASVIFTICDSLKEEYGPLFRKECVVLHTSADAAAQKECSPQNGIVYLGNLELGRERQLIVIGRTLQKLSLPGVPQYLDVYSWERKAEVLRELTPENGIRFHGGVSAQRVLQILQSSMAVIHTESFAPEIRKIVRHSVSTKIPGILRNGSCLIAYGPAGIASMDYLQENGAAYRITAPEQLEQGLREILADGQLRARIVERARALGEKNHSIHTEPARLKARLEEICAEQTVSKR